MFSDLLTMLYIICVAAAIVHILTTKHSDPQAAAMWMLAVVLLPGGGLVCYLFFGISNLRRTGLKMAAARRQLVE
ncbi:MAG: PLDc N-terminal domain-containing protein, partial [Victivallaceae bacterium]|nr:PLDc N-terminal domain-containing protein [Victivallaceae bacterium]